MCVAEKQKENGHGFTLVEVIVVLVILAVLAAIMIPALTGWIDEAKNNAAIVEARTVLTAMQTIASERYGADKVYTLADDEAATMALARVPAGGDIREAAVNSSALVTKMVYLTSQGITVTYLNGVFTIGVKGGGVFENSSAMNALYETLKTSNLGSNGKYYGSGTVGDANFTAFKQQLKTQGIDLDGGGALTWAILNRNHNSTPDYTKVYWTYQDFGAATSKPYMMAYTPYTGNYTIWKVNVTSGANGAYTIQETGSCINDTLSEEAKAYYGITGDNEQSYESMLAAYNKILTDGVYTGK